MLGPQSSLVMYDEEYQRILALLDKLLRESNSKVIFLVDKNGQMIAATGETENLDTTSLASLTAGNIAATGGLAKLIGENDFSTLFHQGAKDSMYLGKIAKGVVLVVLFSKSTTLGLVRLRVKRAVEELNLVIEKLYEKLEYRNEEYDQFDDNFTEEVEAEIDNLFAD